MPDLAALFSADNIRAALIELAILILSISVHEFGHAFVADRLGDPLPRAQKRVTLNPVAHIDPIGTIAFPLLAFFLSAAGSSLGSMMLGWGKPVQVSLSPRSMTRRFRIKTSHLFIAIAGPMMNVLLAAIFSVVYIIFLRARLNEHGLFVRVIAMNIGLALFNLIPCPPLDGGTVLAGLTPDGNVVVRFLRQYGQFIFLALIFTQLIQFIMIPVGILTAEWIYLLRAWAP
jgi:Zn-dependent protease